MISLVIPTYTIDDELEGIALQCAKSYREQVGELIITEDGGQYSEQLRAIANIYIYNRSNGGFTRNVNTGLRVSRGDYVMVVNSDTILKEGQLKDLCIKGRVTSPHIIDNPQTTMHGSFFVIPRNVLRKRGYLDEDLKTYYSDTEYSMRTKDIYQYVDSVKVTHLVSQTVTKAGVNTTGEADRVIYEDKYHYTDN